MSNHHVDVASGPRVGCLAMMICDNVFADFILIPVLLLLLL
jgi:hypothetical protein